MQQHTGLPNVLQGIIFDYADISFDNQIDQHSTDCDLRSSIFRHSIPSSFLFIDEVIQRCCNLEKCNDNDSEPKKKIKSVALKTNLKEYINSDKFPCSFHILYKSVKELIEMYKLCVRDNITKIQNQTIQSDVIVLQRIQTVSGGFEKLWNYCDKLLAICDNNSYSDLLRHKCIAKIVFSLTCMMDTRDACCYVKIWDKSSTNNSVNERIFYNIFKRVCPLVFRIHLISRKLGIPLRDVELTESELEEDGIENNNNNSNNSILLDGYESFSDPFKIVSINVRARASICQTIRTFSRYLSQHKKKHKPMFSKENNMDFYIHISKIENKIKKTRSQLLKNLTDDYGEFRLFFWENTDISRYIGPLQHSLRKPSLMSYWQRYPKKKYINGAPIKLQKLLKNWNLLSWAKEVTLASKLLTIIGKLRHYRLHSFQAGEHFHYGIYVSLSFFTSHEDHFNMMIKFITESDKKYYNNLECPMLYKILSYLFMEWSRKQRQIPTTYNIHNIIMGCLKHEHNNIVVKEFYYYNPVAIFYVNLLASYCCCFHDKAFIVEFCLKQLCFFSAQFPKKHFRSEQNIMTTFMRCLFIPTIRFNINQESRHTILSLCNNLHEITDKILIFLWLDIMHS